MYSKEKRVEKSYEHFARDKILVGLRFLYFSKVLLKMLRRDDVKSCRKNIK